MLIDLLDRLALRPPEIRDVQAHESLFRRGDPARHIFAVEQGHIKLTRYLNDGRAVLLHVAGAGQSFAEAALFSEVYHCHAVADVKARVAAYRKDDLLEAFRRDPAIALEYAARMSRQVQHLRTQLELRNIQSARERIFQYLLQEASPDSLQVDVPIAFKDISAALGLAHETFYRELAALERDGVISREDKKIRILKTGI